MISQTSISSENIALGCRNRVLGLARSALFGVLAIALSACVGSGASTYLENAKRQEIAAPAATAGVSEPSSAPIQPTDNITASSTSTAPNSAAYAEQTVPVKKLAVLQSPPNRPTTVNGTVKYNNGPAIIAASTNSLGLPGLGDPLTPTPNDQRLASLDSGHADETGLSIGTGSTPKIDINEYAAAFRVPLLYASIKHGKCKKKNWAPKPKRVEAKRINPGDPYYIEFRMRNTPLMPVGHTFIVYGKLDGNGEPLDERMVMLAPLGGYAGASLAAALPVPGVLEPYGDDCRIRPETAYRVSLNAQRYEKLLLEIRKVKKEKPVYMLFAQNCNYMILRMAKSIGVRPPKNTYVPAVDFLYDMIEANEGIKINRRYRSKIAGFPDWPQPKAKKRR